MIRHLVVIAAAVLLSVCRVPDAPVAAAGPAAASVREVRVSPVPSSLALRCSEPSIAAHPTDPRRFAVACIEGTAPAVPLVLISHDGGVSWRAARSRPAAGGIHVVIAWGPGPGGRARLYVAQMLSTAGGWRLGTSWSDDEGAHWSAARLQAGVPGWVGGFPDIVADADPRSPNRGTVYAAWNWPRSATSGPGLRVVASTDFGRTWHGVEVPALPSPSGFPVADRIGYRLAPAPDGSVLVDWYQADLRRWSIDAPLDVGGLANIGRIRIGVARLAYDGAARTWSRGPSRTATTLPRTAWNAGLAWPDGLASGPQWTASIKAGPAPGDAVLAVSVDGRIRVCRSGDAAAHWTCAEIPDPPKVAGRAQHAAKPDLIVGDGFVLVGMRTFDRSGATSRNAPYICLKPAIPDAARVRTGPALIALTRMPDDPRSAAR